jgi:hypothetical protein
MRIKMFNFKKERTIYVSMIKYEDQNTINFDIRATMINPSIKTWKSHIPIPIL